MTKDEAKKFFLKGYERGLRDMVSEVLKLAARGYVVIKSKLFERAVEDMDRKIEGGDVDLGLEAPTLGALRGRGSYLVREARGEQVFTLLRELVAKDARPLCITR